LPVIKIFAPDRPSTGIVVLLIALLACFPNPAQSSKRAHSQPEPQSSSGTDISGMYTFLEEGEFVQVTQESDGKITGFVSSYGVLPSDKGAFLDHFFKTASLKGSALDFVTDAVHGVSYSFRGNIARGPGKQPGDEAYWILRGTLTETTVSADQRSTSRSREVELKSFPSGVSGN
jgi:hypothetical protein